jgi:hypothetical protein
MPRTARRHGLTTALRLGVRLRQHRGSSATGVSAVGHTAAMSPLHAYVDESRRRSDDGAHRYLMVAVTVPGGARVALERELRALVPKGSHRLHFRPDRQALNRKHLLLIAEAASAGVHGLAAHAVITSARHEGRARVRCLAALATHLSAAGVDEIVIESRQPHRDVEDDRTLLRARQDGALRPEVLWRHDRPYEEPLLWPADAVAGALGAELTGQDATFLKLLPSGSLEVVWAGEAL